MYTLKKSCFSRALIFSSRFSRQLESCIASLKRGWRRGKIDRRSASSEEHASLARKIVGLSGISLPPSATRTLSLTASSIVSLLFFKFKPERETDPDGHRNVPCHRRSERPLCRSINSGLIQCFRFALAYRACLTFPSLPTQSFTHTVPSAPWLLAADGYFG